MKPRASGGCLEAGLGRLAATFPVAISYCGVSTMKKSQLIRRFLETVQRKDHSVCAA